MNFTGIFSKDISKHWLAVSLYLRMGLAEGETLENIHDRLNAKTCQLWVAKEGEQIIAACVTEIITLAERKVCNIITIGGSGLNGWLKYLATIEAWASAANCAAMRFPEVRPGWQRILKDYKVTKLTIEKEL